MRINLNEVPETVRIDLCAMAILGTMAAMETPEGRAAIEKGRKAYLRHLEELRGEKQGGGEREPWISQATSTGS